MDPAAAFALLDEGLPFLPDGGVDWSRRPFVKRWSARRLGRGGLRSVLLEQAGASSRCRVFAAGDPDAPEVATADAFEAFETLDPTRPRLAIDARGRWIAELSVDGTLSVDFVSRRDTAMLERLRARERAWSEHRGASSPSGAGGRALGPEAPAGRGPTSEPGEPPEPGRPDRSP